MDKNIERFLDRIEGLKAESTAKGYKTALSDYQQWCDSRGIDNIAQVDALTIEDYVIDKGDQGLAPNTVNKRYYKVKKFYGFLDDKLDVVEETPFENIDKKDLSNITKGTRHGEETREDITYLTPEQVDTVADNVPQANPIRNELIVRLLFETGVRKGELINIRLKDIDREEHSIRIWGEKTGDSRTVSYRPSLDFLLNQYIDGGYRSSSMYADSPYLFVSRTNEQLIGVCEDTYRNRLNMT